MNFVKTIILTSCICLTLFSCSWGGKKIVAVSQCANDEWRDQMNSEIRREQLLYDDLEVEIHTQDNTDKQIEEIRSFIDRKVDLIVVSPKEDRVRDVVLEAYQAGIPVILADRKVDTDKYTAFVGGDNPGIGKQAAKFIESRLMTGGRILEIQGLPTSSSNQLRKEGFHKELAKHPEIEIVATLQADWDMDKAEKEVANIAETLAKNPVDIIFAYNDRMAIGAKKAYQNTKGLKEVKKPYIIGVDALMNDSVGIGRIKDGTIQASMLYPTGGDIIVNMAHKILNGEPIEKEYIMKTGVVNSANIHVMLLQSEHMEEQNKKLEMLDEKLDDLFVRYSIQIIILVASVFFIAMAVAAVYFYRKSRQYKELLEDKDREEI